MVPDLELPRFAECLINSDLKAFGLAELDGEYGTEAFESGQVGIENRAVFIGTIAFTPDGARLIRSATSRLDSLFPYTMRDDLDLSGLPSAECRKSIADWITSRLLMLGDRLSVDLALLHQHVTALQEDQDLGLESILRVAGRDAGGQVNAAHTTGDALEGVAVNATAITERARFALGSTQLQGVKQLSESPPGLGFRIVEYKSSDAGVLVHPLSRGATVAVLYYVQFQGIQNVSALVRVENDQSSPVEFGLSLVGDNVDLSAPELFIKTWTVAQPQVYTEVPGSVQIGPSGAAHLLMATRMLNNADEKFAWAFFKRIEIVADIYMGYDLQRKDLSD